MLTSDGFPEGGNGPEKVLGCCTWRATPVSPSEPPAVVQSTDTPSSLGGSPHNSIHSHTTNNNNNSYCTPSNFSWDMHIRTVSSAPPIDNLLHTPFDL